MVDDYRLLDQSCTNSIPLKPSAPVMTAVKDTPVSNWTPKKNDPAWIWPLVIAFAAYCIFGSVNLNGVFSDMPDTKSNGFRFEPHTDPTPTWINFDLWQEVCAYLVIMLIVSILIIRTLRWTAGYIFWGYITLIFTGLAIGFFVTLGLAINASDNSLALIPLGGITLAIIIFALFLYFFYSKIQISIELIKEASLAVDHSNATIFFPIISFLVRALIIFMTVVFCAGFVTNQLKQQVEDCRNGYCLRHDDRGLNNKVKLGLFFFCAIAMWLMAFVQAVTKMILAHVYGMWYWKHDKQLIPSGTLSEGIRRTFSYYLGTAALGSLIITMCRILRRFLRQKRNCRNPLSCIIWLIGSIVRACLKAILELIEFVSNKAFVACAIHGIPFWEGVQLVSRLFIDDIVLVAAITKVTEIVLVLSKLLVSLITAGLFAYYVNMEKSVDVENKTVIAFFAALIVSYFLCNTLFVTHTIAIDTILVCTLEDWARSEGDTNKRYFHSNILNDMMRKQQNMDLQPAMSA